MNINELTVFGENKEKILVDTALSSRTPPPALGSGVSLDNTALPTVCVCVCVCVGT